MLGFVLTRATLSRGKQRQASASEDTMARILEHSNHIGKKGALA